jgi:hypothetical protein
MNTLEDILLKAIPYGSFSPSFFFSMIPLCFPSGVKQCRLFDLYAVTYKFPLAAAAIVTLPDKKCIQIINTTTMRAEQKIKVPVECYGITLIDNDIVLGSRGVICIFVFPVWCKAVQIV